MEKSYLEGICYKTLYESLKAQFELSELGHYRQALPLKALASKIEQVHNPFGLGPPRYLDTEGELSLLFLKPKVRLSDWELVNSLNSDWRYSRNFGMDGSCYPLKQ